jgi:hypothetical protein
MSDRGPCYHRTVLRPNILAPVRCPICNGRGSIVRPNPRSWYQFTRPAKIEAPCSHCDGHGTVSSPVARALEAHEYRGAVETVLNLPYVPSPGKDPRSVAVNELADLLGKSQELKAVEALMDLLRREPTLTFDAVQKAVPDWDPENRAVAIKGLSEFIDDPKWGLTAVELLAKSGDAGIFSWLLRKYLSTKPSNAAGDVLLSDARHGNLPLLDLLERCSINERIPINEVLGLTAYGKDKLTLLVVRVFNRRTSEDLSKYPNAERIADDVVACLLQGRGHAPREVRHKTGFHKFVSDRHVPLILAEIEKQRTLFIDQNKANSVGGSIDAAARISRLVKAIEQRADERSLGTLLTCLDVGREGVPADVVAVISAVLTSVPHKVQEAHLVEISQMHDLEWAEPWGSDEWKWHPVDCSNLRGLARRQLSNRT